MKTTVILSALLFSTLSLAVTIVGDTTPPQTPVGTVTIVEDEIEIEFLPDATVEVVHSEVTINGERS